MTTLLAFDTATEQMSIAVARGERVWLHEAAGGAPATAPLITAVEAVVAGAGSSLAELDAIAFGRGPGAFTGLRTACSVAQGLAYGAAKPVIPIDTLLAIAEDARADAADLRVWALLDARMDELYAAHYRYTAPTGWQVLVAPLLTTVEALNARWQAEAPEAVAGLALQAFGDRLQPGAAVRHPAARPSAAALLRVARPLWAQGAVLDAALALPLYVRDKVAQTTAEREATRLAKAESAA
jgi:tRNA threonylcarbamoyladenosine biosynthesis protein TsaB